MSSDISQENLSSLFKDGISEDLYKLMWAKDELNFGPSINIPDTIVYKYGQPTCWYFTAMNGRVKRKNKHNLISAKIEETFNKHVLGYDVLAYFINVPNEHDPNFASAPTTVEYLDRAALNDFLYNRKKEVNGFLQRFIEPKTTRNEVIRAVWSPKVCLLERAENIHQLHDHRYGLYERCVIYEGPEYYFTSAPLRGPVLSGQIQKLSEAIVSHISEVTFVLNFKVDSRDKIWLLYSTSIRCVDMLEHSSAATSSANRLERTLVNIDSVVSLASTVCLNPMKSYEKILPKARVRCLSCACETLEDMRHPISYKSIIKHYEHVLHLLANDTSATHTQSQSSSGSGHVMVAWPPDKEILEAAGGVGFGCLFVNDLGEVISSGKLEHTTKAKNVRDLQIPPMIHAVHTKLTFKSYHRCKFDPLFLYKTMLVCEPCYLVYAEFSSMLLRMGQDLTKLLTPDPIAATNSSLLLERSSLDRPSSADWRAISTANGSHSKTLNGESALSSAGSFRPSANHRHAKSSAIGLRSSEVSRQPDVPSTIRSTSEQDLAKTYSYYNGGIAGGGSGQLGEAGFTQSQFSSGSPTRGNHNLEFGTSTISTHIGAAYGPEDVKAMIADRERHFFKEISLNPQLKDQHPLMHLISAQQKLKLVDEQSGVLMSKTAAQSESIFGSKYGKQTGDTFHKYSAYSAELPYAINGEIILPSRLRQRRSEQLAQQKITRQKSLQSLLSRDTVEKDDEDAAAKPATKAHAPAGFADPNAKKASQKHRDFLSNALKQIEGEVDGAQPFVGKYSAATGDQSATSSQNGDASSPLANSRAGHGKRGPKKPLASTADSRRSSHSSVMPAVHETVVLAKTTANDSAKQPPEQPKPAKSAKPTKSPSKKEPTSAKSSSSSKLRNKTALEGDGSSLLSDGGASLLDTNSLADNASVGDQSTESLLMQRWGIDLSQQQAEADPAAQQAEMRRIMAASDELYTVQQADLRSGGSAYSLGDAASLGEQSTESVLMRRWGLDPSAADDGAKEEERRMVLAEATPLHELMSGSSVTAGIAAAAGVPDSDEAAFAPAVESEQVDEQQSSSSGLDKHALAEGLPESVKLFAAEKQPMSRPQTAEEVKRSQAIDSMSHSMVSSLLNDALLRGSSS